MKVKAFLKKEKLTLKDLAKVLNKHYNHVTGVIKGTRACSMEMAKAIEEFSSGEVKFTEVFHVCNKCGQKIRPRRGKKRKAYAP